MKSVSSKLGQKQDTTPAKRENKHLSEENKNEEETVSFYIIQQQQFYQSWKAFCIKKAKTDTLFGGKKLPGLLCKIKTQTSPL